MIRVEQDVGLLTNVRMGVEIASALAFLTGRRLSLPFEQPVPGAPQSSIAEADRGRAARVLDLFELPVEIVHSDEWVDLASRRSDVRDWGSLGEAVVVCGDRVDLRDPQLVDFANGRNRFETIPSSDADVLRIDGRLLAFYSYCFFAPPALLRQLRALIRGVRVRRPFVELGSRVAGELPCRFQAVHVRRSDLTAGLPAYGKISAETIADNLAEILDTGELVVVCSEVDEADELFDPLRARFRDLVWANRLILDDHRDDFRDLPRHDDNALGLVTQELAARSAHFVGTIGSTFTAMIQRQQQLREPACRFEYTADFTPPGPKFSRGEFLEVADGSYTWNRIGYAMSPDVLAWFREWPEAV